MALKMTKEVKAYAEREFDKKVEESRDKFFAPTTAERKKIQVEVDARIERINKELSDISNAYGENIRIEWGTNYRNDRKIVYGSVYTKNEPNFVKPDKIRFMAELSSGETLDDISTLLEKFFK